MAQYAELNENNEVIYIIHLDNEVITDQNGEQNELLGIDHLHRHHGDDRKWVRSYSQSETNLRNKNACLGDTYREDLDMFISPPPYPSWSLNEDIGEWEPPIPEPKLTKEQENSNTYYYGYNWDEENQSWNLEETLIQTPIPKFKSE